MKNFKRFGVILLLLALLVSALPSCALVAKPSDQEIREAMEELLPDAKKSAEIVYGKGIEIEENYVVDPDWTAAHYAKVHPSFEIQTVKELKALILRVHTPEYAEQMYEYAFEGGEEIMPRFNEYGGKLTMDVTKDALPVVDEIYPETARVQNGSAYACEVEVEYSTDCGATRQRMTVQMAKVDGKWLFDGPTY